LGMSPKNYTLQIGSMALKAVHVTIRCDVTHNG